MYSPSSPTVLFLPSFRHSIHNLCIFISREMQVYEPLFIKTLRSLLQQLYLLLVVFNESIVINENVSNFLLNLN